MILTEINRVVVELGMDIVVTQQHIVLVVPVQTTHVYTKTGKNQEVHRNGDTTGSVVNTISYLTVQLVSVIPTGINRAVVIEDGKESAEPLQNIVLVRSVQTTGSYIESGELQMVHRSGDTTGGVVVTSPYLTVHLVSVILTEINRVVLMCGMDGVET